MGKQPVNKSRNLTVQRISKGELFALCTARCLRALREHLSFNQADLAEYTDMTQPNWSKVERTGIINIAQLHLACDSMGTTPFRIIQQSHSLYDGILSKVLDLTKGDVPEEFNWSKKNVAEWCDATLLEYYETAANINLLGEK
jgi:transcriptional regulator with XRE-family HTH domain